ncbi:MAG TPA: aldolase/citrate lyase family protein [Patescibacteria group bacterium]|nr:aldolase/citrate lyase family protein [Patescibacteria group bacterium]
MWGKNRLMEILEAGRLAVGSCVYSSSPALVELMGYCGLDFCRIDNEHSWRRDESMENMVRAATISGVVPLLRVDRDDPNVIRKALEIGAGGVLIPHVLNAEEVEGIVRMAKFPPRGDRGIGSLCFSGRWGTVKATDWIRWSDEEQMVGVMIEDYRTLEQLDEIMAVEGLDYVLFGASDFSTSIGHPGEGSHPRVMEALRETVRAADRHGKYVCKGVGYPWVENARKFVEMGCHMIELGHDASILRVIWAMKGEEIRGLK